MSNEHCDDVLHEQGERAYDNSFLRVSKKTTPKPYEGFMLWPSHQTYFMACKVSANVIRLKSDSWWAVTWMVDIPTSISVSVFLNWLEKSGPSGLAFSHQAGEGIRRHKSRETATSNEHVERRTPSSSHCSTAVEGRQCWLWKWRTLHLDKIKCLLLTLHNKQCQCWTPAGHKWQQMHMCFTTLTGQWEQRQNAHARRSTIHTAVLDLHDPIQTNDTNQTKQMMSDNCTLTKLTSIRLAPGSLLTIHSLSELPAGPKYKNQSRHTVRQGERQKRWWQDWIWSHTKSKLSRLL